MNSRLKAVYDAWNSPGPHPKYHHHWQNYLRRTWPTLAKALDALKEEDLGG